MMDPHTHLRDLAWSNKASFASETAAALAGGYTLVCDMPNTPPATINPAALRAKLLSIAAQAYCDYGVYYGAAQHDNWHSYAEIAGQVCGLKLYNNQTTGDLLLEKQSIRAQHYAHWHYRQPIAVHAEGATVLDILALVREYRRPTHFCHISSADEIHSLRAAKAEGLPISIGVCPHHLYLTEDDLPRLGAFGLMKPELKTRADQAALWEAVRDGLVDVIESDHAPHTLHEKQSPQAYYGVPGLETTLPLMCLALHEKRLTEAQLLELLALAPRRLWAVPADADTYTLVDLDASYLIEGQNLRGACGWTPFEGMRVYGRVREVWIRGQQVYDGEHILAAPGSGRNAFIQRGH